MKTVTSTIAFLTITAAGVAQAQDSAFNSQDAAGNAVESVEESVNESFERDTVAFGNSGRPLGWTGSMSARATASSGNTEATDIGIGARLNHFDGVNGHRIALSFSYGEDEGKRTENRLLASYDYTREFGQNMYFYGQLQTAQDEFDSFESDNFLGLGVGYRILNTANQQWSVQAGPGYRSAELNDGSKIEESAWSVSSNYYQDITDTLAIFNDTDILGSESDTYVVNELGVNVAMTNALALQTSILTEYHSDPLPGFDDTDNTLGVSVVYSFK